MKKTGTAISCRISGTLKELYKQYKDEVLLNIKRQLKNFKFDSSILKQPLKNLPKNNEPNIQVITFAVDKKIVEDFKNECKRVNLTPSMILRRLIMIELNKILGGKQK